MRLARLEARGFRNLADVEREVPREGVVLLGRNGQGKTNLLEAMAYPVLFRSVRGAPDQEVARHDGPGFRVSAGIQSAASCELAATVTGGPRRKRVTVDGAEPARLADAIGRWTAVAFLPSEVALAAGPGQERRRYLDRTLALSARGYLTGLTRYRAALAQRNAALRQGRLPVARAFDAALAEAGAAVVRERLRWMGRAEERYREALDLLGGEAGSLEYRGEPELAEAGAWPAALAASERRDGARGTTTVGPHRHDLALALGGRALRAVGSTGQLRTAAVALKLLEVATIEAARGEAPAFLLDDVFAELDTDRQRRLGAWMQRGERQIVVTAPRRDELPPGIALPVWEVDGGTVCG